jgi:hypothetical protein
MTHTASLSLVFASALGLCAAGCSPAAPPSPVSGGTVTSPPPGTVAPAHDDHGHASEGPHHGALVELGNEEYHAEVVHDDTTGSVTVYLLDSSAKKSATTTATEAVINLKHGDSPEPRGSLSPTRNWSSISTMLPQLRSSTSPSATLPTLGRSPPETTPSMAMSTRSSLPDGRGLRMIP